MGGLLAEVVRFQNWAEAIPRASEWECDYEEWSTLYDAVLQFVADRPSESWADAELQAVLYAIARDNEAEYLVDDIREKHPHLIIPLARVSLEAGEPDARWQLAVGLGHLRSDREAEELLLALAQDENEYVRRRALQSLVRIGSTAIESLVLAEWHREDKAQEWARINVLNCLYKLGSRQLEPLLEEAELDPRPNLREYAAHIRRGESLD